MTLIAGPDAKTRGPGRTPAVERELEIHVREARTLGSEVAHGRKAVVEGDGRGSGGAQGAIGARFEEHLFVVFSRRRVPLQQEVRVRVDEAGQTRVGREVEDGKTGGFGGFPGR